MDPHEKCPPTEKLSEVRRPQEQHAPRGPNKTPHPPPARRDTPLKIPGMWTPFVESTLRGDGAPNKWDTRRQRWNQVTADGFCGGTTTGPLEALWGSHSHGVDIWLFVLTETERRLRHELKLLLLRFWETPLEILTDLTDL